MATNNTTKKTKVAERALTEAEITAVRANLGWARDRAIFEIGLATGFRISEILSLHVADVYTTTGEVRASISVGKANMKENKGRTVRVSTKLSEVLKAYFPVVAAGSVMFPSRKGTENISRVQAHRILEAAFAAAGINDNVSTHSMRKTFAKKVYDVTGDVYKTQKMLGHSAITSTVKYLNSVLIDEEDIINSI
jgi:site-specific recombinase XerD